MNISKQRYVNAQFSYFLHYRSAQGTKLLQLLHLAIQVLHIIRGAESKSGGSQL